MAGESIDEDTLEAFLASEPPYEGKDPNTSTEPYCMNCFRKESDGVDELQRCSRCKCLYFCSTECQREFWPEHKEPCNKISKLEKSVEKHARKLRSTNEHAFGQGEPENLFETKAGHFWGIFETRDYISARFDLAEEIYRTAYEVETAELWNMVLNHYQELLRLCSSDNIGVRFKFPFVLLYLNRDDDCYAFCRNWLKWEDEDYDEREEKHARSQEGDWLYEKEEGCRYLDIFEECSQQDPKYMDLPFLVAICIIKLRLVAAYDAKVKRGIEVTDDETAKAKSNRGQVQRLMDQIHESNPSMLPSLINPMPFKSQPLPDYHSIGHPNEAYLVLNNSNRCWIRVPGAEEMLVERFGTSSPTYNHNLG